MTREFTYCNCDAWIRASDTSIWRRITDTWILYCLTFLNVLSEMCPLLRSLLWARFPPLDRGALTPGLRMSGENFNYRFLKGKHMAAFNRWRSQVFFPAVYEAADEIHDADADVYAKARCFKWRIRMKHRKSFNIFFSSWLRAGFLINAPQAGTARTHRTHRYVDFRVGSEF